MKELEAELDQLRQAVDDRQRAMVEAKSRYTNVRSRNKVLMNECRKWERKYHEACEEKGLQEKVDQLQRELEDAVRRVRNLVIALARRDTDEIYKRRIEADLWLKSEIDSLDGGGGA